jgi:hypothetical protein
MRVDLDEDTARMRAEDLHVRDFFNIPNVLFRFLESLRRRVRVLRHSLARPGDRQFAGHQPAGLLPAVRGP